MKTDAQQPNIGEAITWGADQLNSCCDEPIFESRLLLAHCMDVTSTYLWAWPEKNVPTAALDSYQAAIERRKHSEPLAYIVGYREFWSREFRVTPSVLIPRPETELLVEIAIQLIGQKADLRIADLGTGSGIIAITLKLESGQNHLIAVDQSQAALSIAMKNAQIHEAEIEFIHGDWLNGFAPESLDIIVTNPPYIAESDPHLSNSDIRNEPLSALASGPNGLNDIETIAAQAITILKPGGHILIEHGFDQATPVREILTQHGFTDIQLHLDLQSHPRVSRARKPLAS